MKFKIRDDNTDFMVNAKTYMKKMKALLDISPRDHTEVQKLNSQMSYYSNLVEVGAELADDKIPLVEIKRKMYSLYKDTMEQYMELLGKDWDRGCASNLRDILRNITDWTDENKLKKCIEWMEKIQIDVNEQNLEGFKENFRELADYVFSS